MQPDFLKMNERDRRDFISLAAKTCLGVSFLPALQGAANAADIAERKNAAEHVIYLFMNGAMSHIDTFDPKPKNKEVQGPTKVINTSVPSIQIGEHLPNLAKQMKKLAIIRSLYTETGAHEQGRYLMRTSYKEIATIRHPAMGAWLTKMKGSLNRTLPANVVVGGANRHPGAGYMETRFNPIPIGNPNDGLKNTEAPKYLSQDRFDQRMDLINRFDTNFRRKFDHKAVKDYTEFYNETVKLLQSKELKAFDLNQEEDSVRDKYGRNSLGQGCLLARRLVENKVRFVEVNYGSWDHHNNLSDAMTEKGAALDQALSSLITDLQNKGLLQKTLIVVTSEFGRKPKMNQNAGRDHHPGAFSGLLVGGGIRGGQVYGASDEDGHHVDEDGVTPAEFNSTIAYGLGLPLQKEVFSPDGRPFTVSHDGEPITKLFS